MSYESTFSEMKRAIDAAPRNAYVAEIHVQVLKHAHMLEQTSGKDFCAALGLTPSFGSEFLKMKKIAPRLRAAGLNPSKI
ncbi:HTH-like domain-containing protein [Brevundimonas sp.]|uniref:HTH-like domain-containing protein n=1 Tax=Brevundimonas sp. TaxID=1871086 RepID=UPI002FCB0AAD